MRHLRFIIIAVVVFGLVYASTKASAIVPGDNQRVSLMYNGQQTPSNYGSPESFLSADGKKVVFRSQSPNIIQGGGPGIFERDLATGSVIKINVSTSGVQQTGDLYIPKAVSSNGRFVLFIAEAPNLIDGQTTDTAHWQLYLRDTLLSVTTLVTKSMAGATSNGSGFPTTLGVSSDGRFVVFTSNATNLDSDATDGFGHLYRLDRLDSQLSLIDRKTDGSLGSTSSSWSPEGGMSCDGSLIAFQYPSSLIVGETSTHIDIYLLDLRSGTHLTNITKGAQWSSEWPTISCNGDYIGFMSPSSNLDAAHTTGYQGNQLPYVYDRMSDRFHLAAVTPTGDVPTSGLVCSGQLSYAGSGCKMGLSDTGLAAFASNNSSLAGSSFTQIYLTNIYSGTTEVLSKSSSGSPGNNESSIYPTLSRDGTLAGYSSLSSNLVPNDTNSQVDAFVSQTGY